MATATRDTLNVPNILNEDMSTKCKRLKSYASWRIYHPRYPRSLFCIPHSKEETSCAQMINTINDLQIGEWGIYLDMNIKGQPSLVFNINEDKSYKDMKSKGITRKIKMSTKDKIVGAAAVAGAAIISGGIMYYRQKKIQLFTEIYKKILKDYNGHVITQYTEHILPYDIIARRTPEKTKELIDEARSEFFRLFEIWKTSIRDSKSSEQMINALIDITSLTVHDVVAILDYAGHWMTQREKEFKTIETEIQQWVKKHPDQDVPINPTRVNGTTIISSGKQYETKYIQVFIEKYTEILNSYTNNILIEIEKNEWKIKVGSWFISDNKKTELLDESRRDFFRLFEIWKTAIRESKSSDHMINVLNKISSLVAPDTLMMMFNNNKDVWMMEREKEFKKIEAEIGQWVNGHPYHAIPSPEYPITVLAHSR